MKRHAASMIEDAKKIETSLIYNQNRIGKTLDMGDLEPIEGWEYTVDPWPGRAVREMSPLSSIADDDVEQLEKEIFAHDKLNAPTPSRAVSRGRGNWRARGRGRGRWRV
jgi:hypothetical protein